VNLKEWAASQGVAYITARRQYAAGTMDDSTAGPRIRDLRQQLVKLHARHDELEADLATQPAPPPADTIAKIRNHLSTIMTKGTPTERKAAIETLIHEVQLTDQGARPMFKIPTNDTALPDGSHQEEECASVRTMVRSVEPRLRHKNQKILASGPDLELPVARERQLATTAG
jgi:hypothetical protein